MVTCGNTEPSPAIYPIGGGKGGVGKSFVAASLGALIARQGKTVALIDLDLGASNLHTFLGMPAPENGLNRFLSKTVQSLERAAVSTQITNLFFISSCNCSMEIANLFYAQKIKLIKAIKKLPYDFVLIDLGAGTHFNTLDFFLTASKGIFVCTPDPTSIENAFRFIKAVYLRRLKQLIKRHDFDTRVKAAILNTDSNALKSRDIIDIVLKNDPEKESFLKARIGRFQFKMILNQFRKTADIHLGEKIKTVCNRHFYSPFDFLGQVDFDERVMDSIYARKLYVKTCPATATRLGIETNCRLAHPYATDPTVKATGAMKTFDDENYYQILQVNPNAGANEIKHAYREALAIYEENSVATYSLFSAEQREGVLQAIETAFDTLSNEKKRADYNQMLIDTGQVDAAIFSRQVQRKMAACSDIPSTSREASLRQWVHKKASEPEIRQRIQAILSQERLSGLDLKQLREAYGIDIHEIYTITKISSGTLKIIEADQYADLPAEIYVKQFLKTYAELLHLDPRHVVDSYFQMMARKKSNR